MKSIYYGLLYVGAIIALAFLSGCEKRDISDAERMGNHMILIDPDNTSTYDFAIFGSEDAWVTLPNGTGYEFCISGKTITVVSRLTKITGSWYLRDAFQKQGTPLEISDKNGVSHSFSGSYSDIFEFKY